MTTTFTAGILDSYAPWLNTDSTNYLTALASLFETVYGITADQGYPDDADYTPGWGNLLDPDNCPAQFLPYLAQFTGTSVPKGTNETDARATIKAESGFGRGTVASIATAAKRWLNGTQFYRIIERTSDAGTEDAYHFQLVVRPSEVIDATKLTAAVDAVRPAGVQWTLVQATGYPWSTATRIWSNETMTWQMTDVIAP